MTDTLSIIRGLRILHVSDGSDAPGASVCTCKSGSWLGKALREARGVHPYFYEVRGSFEGMKAMQSQPFDVTLVSLRSAAALDFISGCRTSGITLPILILGCRNEPNLWTQCCERGGDGWISLDGTTVSDLLWQMALAVERRRDAERCLRLESRLEQEKNAETEENLKYILEQRATVQKLHPETSISEELAARYLELLKSYLLASSQDFTPELQNFCRDLFSHGVTLAELAVFHLQSLEKLLRSLERKSPRRLMHRAHLLLGEISIRFWDMNEEKEENSVRKSLFPGFIPETH